jgi:carbonic anhydrase
MIDNWLSGIRALRRMHRLELDALPPEAAVDRLCELNVLAQARHVAHTTIIEDAWDRGQKLSVHSWIYRLDQRHHHPARPAHHQRRYASPIP